MYWLGVLVGLLSNPLWLSGVVVHTPKSNLLPTVNMRWVADGVEGVDENNQPQPAVFCIYRSNVTDFNQPLTIKLEYAFKDGTGPEDFENLPATITIPGNAFSANLELHLVDDDIAEPKGAIIVRLKSSAEYAF